MLNDMTKKVLLILVLIASLAESALCATTAGTSIESRAFITYGSATTTSEIIYASVAQIYGVEMSRITSEAAIPGGEFYYFPMSVANIGNGTERIYLSSEGSPDGWTTNLVIDANRDDSFEAGETAAVPPSIVLAEDADYKFFLVLDAPDAAVMGTHGWGTVTASTETNDGPAYFGGNGVLYGGDDIVSQTCSLSIESLGNARIWRDDANKKIYLTWGGGPGDIFYRTDLGTSFDSASIEASNVPSPWTSEAVFSRDGTKRYYRVAQPGTTVFARNILGKFDIAVSVGLNELSSPFIPFDTSIASVVGSQVTGASNAFAADKVLKYDPLVQARYDMAWLVYGVGAPYDGTWYTGNSPTGLSIEADEGFVLQIRPGHPADYITFVGKVSEVDRYIDIGVGMNFVGTCFPVEVPLGDQSFSGDSNLWESGATGAPNAFSSDKVLSYDPAVQAYYDFAWLIDRVNPTYNGIWYTGNGPTFIKLKPGRGYWVQVKAGHAPFTWHYPKPY